MLLTNLHTEQKQLFFLLHFAVTDREGKGEGVRDKKIANEYVFVLETRLDKAKKASKIEICSMIQHSCSISCSK